MDRMPDLMEYLKKQLMDAKNRGGPVTLTHAAAEELLNALKALSATHMKTND